MTFQNPQLLWLLLLLAAPLLLYLLPMPRRRVLASAVFLWERFLSSERFGRASERFRRALGFALFCAILASLILATAELSLGKAAIQARKLIALIDTSASMNAVFDGRSNLERAKGAAARLIESLDAETQVALVEAPGELRVVAPFRQSGSEAARRVWEVEPFDGPADLRRILEQAYDLWGESDGVEIYVFTDAELPESHWGERAHAWIAPAAGDNAAITALSVQRRGRDIVARFTLANYGRTPRALAGSALANGVVRKFFAGVALGPGETTEHTVRVEEAGATALQVRLEGAGDALKTDDEARAVVPSLDDLRVRVVWPDAGKRNTYVRAVLSALRDEGVVGPVWESAGSAAATIFVNQSPDAWPDGGAIVLYPLRSGVVEVAGLHSGPASVTRQAPHPLLRDVDLRGLTVKGAVRATVPEWAEPLVWAGELPLVWAGQTGRTKILFVGIPPTPSGSRLPLVASFPVLMRNALLWMLPSPRALRPGERVHGWTSRKTGLAQSPVDGETHAFGLLSATESDLRRERPVESDTFAGRRSLAFILIAVAIVLLPVEWGLFHKRLTE